MNLEGHGCAATTLCSLCSYTTEGRSVAVSFVVLTSGFTAALKSTVLLVELPCTRCSLLVKHGFGNIWGQCAIKARHQDLTGGWVLPVFPITGY